MDLFPTKVREFELIDSKERTLERLIRRTEKSKNLTSAHTDRSFRGIVEENQFKLISSEIGRGAFCVMSGNLDNESGMVKVEIHKVFKVFLSVLFCFPIIGVFVLIGKGTHEHPLFLICIALLQTLMLRYVFISFAFKYLSKASLNRFRDVLDLKWKKSRSK